MLELLIDNDVLIKTSRYGVISELIHFDCSDDCDADTGVLGAARFVVGKNLARAVARGIADESAVSDFEATLARLHELEPTGRELDLASAIEGAAIDLGLELDTGESQLFAIAVARERPVVLTGDKRAISALEQLLESVPQILALTARVACLEQLMARLTQTIGAIALRASVCADRQADQAMGICFQCSNPSPPDDFFPSGLLSYISDIRSQAPTVLVACDALSLRD